MIYLLSSKTHTIWVFFFIMCFVWLMYDKTYSMAVYAWMQIILLYSFYNIIEQSVVFSYVNTKVYNTTLQNGLLYMHPIMMYYAYAIVFYVWLWYYYLNSMHYFFKSRGPNLYINSMMVTAGILLGAWWAAQEFNWGGFWSWDPIELLSLIIWGIILVLFHFNKNFFVTLNNIMSLFIMFFLIYSMLSLGVINTIHAFMNSGSVPLMAINMALCMILYMLYKMFNVCYYIMPKKMYHTVMYINMYMKLLYSLCAVLIMNLYLLMIKNNFYIFEFALIKLNKFILILIGISFFKNVFIVSGLQLFFSIKFLFFLILLYFYNVNMMMLIFFFLFMNNYFLLSAYRNMHMCMLYMYFVGVFFFC